MAIHPNSGKEFDASDPDGYSIDDGVPKKSHHVAPSAEQEEDLPWEEEVAAAQAKLDAVRAKHNASKPEKPKTVSVTSQLDRPIVIHQHELIKDDGANRSFQGRRLDGAITINPGVNPGIDKAAFTNWQEQNSGSALHALFTVTDED